MVQKYVAFAIVGGTQVWIDPDAVHRILILYGAAIFVELLTDVSGSCIGETLIGKARLGSAKMPDNNSAVLAIYAISACYYLLLNLLDKQLQL